MKDFKGGTAVAQLLFGGGSLRERERERARHSRKKRRTIVDPYRLSLTLYFSDQIWNFMKKVEAAYLVWRDCMCPVRFLDENLFEFKKLLSMIQFR